MVLLSRFFVLRNFSITSNFLSHLLSCSLSYFLFPHPITNFTMYLPGNPLSSFCSSLICSCYLTSLFFFPYFLSNSSTSSFVFPRFSLPFHVSASAMNSFYCTKNLSFYKKPEGWPEWSLCPNSRLWYQKNSIEFPLNCYCYLYILCLVCAPYD